MLKQLGRFSPFKTIEEKRDSLFSFEWEPFSPEPLDTKQFQWVTWGRLVLVFLLLAAIFLFSNYLGPIVEFPNVILKVAYLSLAALAVTYGYIQWYKTGSHLKQLTLLQITLDILFVAAIVYVTGMASSPFLFLFPLIVLVACLLQGRAGGQFSALFFTLLYVVIVWLDKTFLLRDTTNLLIFFVNIVVVNLTALIAGVLAERLRHAESRLSMAVVDLKRVKEMQQHLADSMISGLIMLHTNGQILALNRRAEAILGVKASDYVGRMIHELWPDVKKSMQDISQWFLKSDDGRREIVYEGSSGKIVLGLSGFAMRDDKGALLGYGIIFQDLTEIRRQEERLRRVEKLASLGEMAAGMAHEIRNPLASISGVVEFLQESQMVDADANKLLDILQREIHRLSELTQSFLLYAKPERGGEQPVNVLDAVNETIGLLSSRKLARMQVIIQIPPDFSVYVNPGQFRQVLLNLILNAVQAMAPKMEQGEKGELFVGVEPVIPAGHKGMSSGALEIKQHIVLIVRDNGIGMSKEIMDHIFDPFFTTRSDGTGLGLSIVQRLVESWGGEVECSSEPGKGTEFRVMLPVLSSPKN